MAEPSSVQGQRPIATSTKEISRVAKLEVTERLQPTAGTSLNGSLTDSHIRIRSDGRPSQKSKRQICQRKVGLSSNSRPTNSSRRGAKLPRYGRLLTAPKPFDGLPARRLPKCLWSLLSIALSPPDIPVVAVTSPEGEVKYPFDHNYYGDTDSEDDGSGNSSEWEDIDTSDMEDQVTCRF
ncbi:hypothetical protein F4805DRAFT_79897 [Annulohypoxylon moriforme]|nr:hypothetical protein F4805DRAFT_79897 [Annulohypoxylon moriforme]